MAQEMSRQELAAEIARLQDLVCQYQAGKVSDLYREENQ